MPYDALRDFALVSLITGTGSVMLAHPSLPAKNVRELIALARTRGYASNYGTAGSGTNPQISGELFNCLAKTNVTAVHFKGGGPAMIAIASGKISLGFPALPDALGYARSAPITRAAPRLRALRVTSAKRAPQQPDIAAIAQTLPGYEFTAWQGLLAPRNTPRAIFDRLSARTRTSLAASEAQMRFNDLCLEIIGSTPEAFLVHLKKRNRGVERRHSQAQNENELIWKG